MTQITHNGFLLVTDDAKDKPLYYFVGTDNRLYRNYGQIDLPFKDALPPGRWQLIGLAAELTPSFLESIGFGDVAVSNGLQLSTTVILKQIEA